MIATQKMKSFPQSNLCIGKAFQAHLVKLILSTQLICFIKSDLCHKWDKSESFWLCMLLCAHIPYKHTCVHYTNMPASPHHSSRHNALVPEKYALFLAFFWCSALQHPQTGISAGANQHVLRDSCAPVRLLDSSILRLIWFFQFLLAFAFTVLTCPEKLVFAF